MKQIDIKRFWLTLKCIIISDSRQIVKRWGGIVAAIFLAEMFVTRIVDAQIPLSAYDDRINNMAVIGLFIVGVVALRNASDIFRNMKETRQRTQFLMIPASSAEKFCARWIYVTVVWTLLTFVAFCVADCLRMLVDAITNDRALLSAVVALVRSLSDGSGTHAYDLLMLSLFSLCVLVHGFYVLGGSLFRRAQFVLTSAAGITLMLLFIKLLQVFRPFEHFTLVGFTDNGLYVSPWVYAFIGSCLVVALVFYWLSYLLFKRMQVINNKWLNV